MKKKLPDISSTRLLDQIEGSTLHSMTSYYIQPSLQNLVNTATEGGATVVHSTSTGTGTVAAHVRLVEQKRINT